MLKIISLSNIKSFSTESLKECEIANLLKKLKELKQKFSSKQDYKPAGFTVMLEKLNGCKKPKLSTFFPCTKEPEEAFIFWFWIFWLTLQYLYRTTTAT